MTGLSGLLKPAACTPQQHIPRRAVHRESVNMHRVTSLQETLFDGVIDGVILEGFHGVLLASVKYSYFQERK